MKKQNIRGFFTGYKGQRVFNYAYSIGASIVILGALFKLLHWPFADPMLILGMGTEAVIFFLSAFDEPARDYRWENVFPILGNEEATPEDAPEFPMTGNVSGNLGGGTIIINGGTPVEGTIEVGTPATATSHVAATAVPSATHSVVSAAPVGLGDTDAATEATASYVKQLTELNESLSKLQESLSHNIQGLNAMYELQLRDAGSQLSAVNRVHQETEQMTQTIAQLNAIYERMLAAMQPENKA